MGPRGTPKSTAAYATAKVHQQKISNNKCNTTIKSGSVPTTLQRSMLTRRRSLNFNSPAEDLSEVAAQPERQRQPLTQPMLNQNKPPAQLGSVTNSSKKPSWARRPKPAHSGVPVPEKMRKLFENPAKEAPQQNATEVRMDCVKTSLNDNVEVVAQPEGQRQPLTPLKQNKPPAPPGSVTKSGKKPTWARRPKPAHSGVPVPEKMRKLFEKLAKEGKQL